MFKSIRTAFCLLTMGAFSFAVTPEEAKGYAPPSALQAKLDTFFKKHAEDFKIPKADDLAAEFDKLRKAHAHTGTTAETAGSGPEEIIEARKVHKPPFESLAEKLAKEGCKVLNAEEKSLVFTASELGDVVVKMPGWVFMVIHGHGQYNLKRLDGAAMIRHSLVRTYLQNHLVVPAKYLYHLPWRGTELNDSNYIVVAEKVDLGGGSEAVGPLAVLAMLNVLVDTGQNDLHAGNIHAAGGRFVLVDTAEYFDFTAAAIQDYCHEHGDRVKALSKAIHKAAAQVETRQLPDLVPVFRKVYAVLELIPNLEKMIESPNMPIVEEFQAGLMEEIQAWPDQPKVATRHPAIDQAMRAILRERLVVETGLQ